MVKIILGIILCGVAWTFRANEFSIIIFVQGMITLNFGVYQLSRGRSISHM